jgi:hypothetical protein
MTVTPRLTLDHFKQIFRDHLQSFLCQYPEYQRVSSVIEKMLGCGDPARGYSEYRCPHCHEQRVVAFS